MWRGGVEWRGLLQCAVCVVANVICCGRCSCDEYMYYVSDASIAFLGATIGKQQMKLNGVEHLS